MNIKDYPQGLLFDGKLQAEIKDRFWNVDSDPEAGKRLFFENAGGSLRLKAVNKAYEEADTFPDCDSRKHPRAKALRQLTLNGFRDLRIMFNAPRYGQIIAEKSSSKVMFEMVRTVLENIKGTNVVVTDLDHPSAYDSVMYYGRKAGMEVRIAKPNKVTGGIDAEEIERLVDKDTALLVCIYASNHTGAVMDMKEIVTRARAIKPDLYIISDAVQHMPTDWWMYRIYSWMASTLQHTRFSDAGDSAPVMYRTVWQPWTIPESLAIWATHGKSAARRLPCMQA